MNTVELEEEGKQKRANFLRRKEHCSSKKISNKMSTVKKEEIHLMLFYAGFHIVRSVSMLCA